MKKLIIVDLFGIIFKAYYTFFHTPLNTSKGESSSTIYGFFRIFMSAIRKFSPNYLIIASESKTETFRHKLYKEYKSHRKDKPEDLKAQISVIIKILQAFQFPLISEEGFEADDIIGSICEKYKNHKDLEILILSQDKDIHQLIRKNIHIISSIKGFSEFIEYDEKKSLKKWDIPTNQIIDYLALIGDPSDNIPGGKGIGPKTALSILNDFKSLNEIYQNLDHFKPAIRKKLLTSKQNIFLSQKLVTIKTDIPLNIPIEDCEMPSIHLSKEGIEYFQHYEFSSLIKDIPKIFEKNGAISQTTLKCYNEINSNYQLITTQKEFFLLIENLKKCQYLSIDIETDSLDIITAKIIGISFCTEKNSAFFLPIPSKENRFPSKWIENEKLQTSDLKQNLIFSELKKILEDKKIKKIGQNIKFDYMIIKNQAGIDMQNIYFDTMIASFILHPNFERHNLDFLAEKFLDYKTIYYSEIIPKKDLTLKDIEIEKVSIYAAEDADISFQIYQKLSPVINYSEMKYLFYSIEMPLLKILGNMQLYGVGVDIKYWKNLYKKLDLKINDLEKRIFDIVKEKFNINSPKQLSNILFKKLNLKPKRKTKTDYSTDNETLNTLKKQSEAIPLILSYRTLNKICTTYLSLKYIHTNTNRIHTTYNQVKTRTGRLSSSSPNLQNIPNEHHKLSKALRKGFIVPKGNLLLCADYSQIELRILAHFSNDEKLIEAYKNNEDIHTKTAALIFDKKLEDITSKERQIAKTLNFSIIYGAGARNISKQIHISKSKAVELIEKYFNIYSGIKEYIEHQKIDLKKTYSKTLLHRIRYIDPMRPDYQRLAAMINTPIQGTSADIIKLAMVKIQEDIDKNNLKSCMIMQIHDELILEIPILEYDKIKAIVKEKMENAYPLKVPLKVSMYTCDKYWYKKQS